MNPFMQMLMEMQQRQPPRGPSGVGSKMDNDQAFLQVLQQIGSMNPGYKPGERESTNVEDRRGEPSPDFSHGVGSITEMFRFLMGLPHGYTGLLRDWFPQTLPAPPSRSKLAGPRKDAPPENIETGSTRR